MNCLEDLRLRRVTCDETHHILEIAEVRKLLSTIFCTQFDSKGWLARINSSTDGESLLPDSVIDRIIYNSYRVTRVTIHGLKSMRKRHVISSDEI